MQARATAMLRIWFSGWFQLALSALYSTSRLISSSKLIPSINDRSMCAVRSCHSCRLVMFASLLHFRFGQWPGHFPKQIVIEHFACYRRYQPPAVPAVFDQHRQRDLRLLGRGKSDEPGVVAMLLLDLFSIIFFPLIHSDHLRGAGLAGNVIGRTKSSIHRRATRLRYAHHGAT